MRKIVGTIERLGDDCCVCKMQCPNGHKLTVKVHFLNGIDAMPSALAQLLVDYREWGLNGD